MRKYGADKGRVIDRCRRKCGTSFNTKNFCRVCDGGYGLTEYPTEHVLMGFLSARLLLPHAVCIRLAQEYIVKTFVRVYERSCKISKIEEQNRNILAKLLACLIQGSATRGKRRVFSRGWSHGVERCEFGFQLPSEPTRGCNAHMPVLVASSN